MRARVWKTKCIPGVFYFEQETWVMSDGWVHVACNSWEDAMRKARRKLRETIDTPFH